MCHDSILLEVSVTTKSGNRIARSCVLSTLSRVVIFAASLQLLTLAGTISLIVTHVFKYIPVVTFGQVVVESYLIVK